MNLSSEYHLLIVDAPSERACSLRNALVTTGATVHVVSSPAVALMVAKRRKIHAAFVACDTDMDMAELCDALQVLNVSLVFTGAIRLVRPKPQQPTAWESLLAAAQV
jgi:PleD family two-component response regulator